MYIYMVFSLNIRFHTESWPKWDSSPRPDQTVLFLFPNLSKISPPESTCAVYSKFL